MITQRQIDIWHVEAQGFMDKIRNDFLTSLQGNRAEQIAQPTAQPPMMNPAMQPVPQEEPLQPGVLPTEPPM